MRTSPIETVLILFLVVLGLFSLGLAVETALIPKERRSIVGGIR